MDDDAVIELIKLVKVNSENSERIKELETKFLYAESNISDLKTQQKEEPKETENRKSKKIDYIFRIITLLLAALGSFLGVYNTFFK